MSGSYFPEEMDGSFFDDILGDVPEIDGPGEGDLFLANWPPADTDSLTVSDSVFSANSNLDLSAELSVSYEDIVQFERLTNFVDDSLTGEQNLTMNDNETWPPASETQIANNPFQTSSPVSVLESGSPCSGDKTLPYGPKGVVDGQEVNIPVLPLVGPPKAPTSGVVRKRGRARSKRSRPTSPILPIAVSGNRAIRATGATGLVIRFPKQFLSGQKEKKMKISRDHEEEEEEEEVEAKEKQCTMRKCMHCESTKTPQWRAGPMGPKTLCNACGVRYKTGRLFPEYRPAASPTFVPTIHSNSHKKVIEMRKRSDDGMIGGGHVRPSTSLDY